MNLEFEIEKEDLTKIYIEKLLDKASASEKIIIFGTGHGGEKAYQMLCNNGFENKIFCFCDNNRLKTGNVFYGKKIIHPDLLDDVMKQYLFIITPAKSEEVQLQLKQLSVEEKNVVICDLAFVEWNESDFDYIWKNFLELKKIYELLADKKSKQVFKNLLNYKITKNKSLLKEIANDDSEQYFPSDILHFTDKITYIDAGAYDGDTIEAFLKRYSGNYKKIYAIEANKENFNQLKTNAELKKWENIELLNIGAYKEKGKLKFNTSLGWQSGQIDESGDNEILVDSIDNILAGEKVDYIKMDIEGSEYDAILGCKETIKKYKPTLAICVYHKKDDFVNIPNLILKLEPGYHLYFRHYHSQAAFDTLCYAVYGD